MDPLIIAIGTPLEVAERMLVEKTIAASAEARSTRSSSVSQRRLELPCLLTTLARASAESWEL